jgi:hypothetical protein
MLAPAFSVENNNDGGDDDQRDHCNSDESSLIQIHLSSPSSDWDAESKRGVVEKQVGK